MTDKEFLDSLDVVPLEDGLTVTIPLSMYNILLESNAKLQVVIKAYQNATSFDFKELFRAALGIKKENADD